MQCRDICLCLQALTLRTATQQDVQSILRLWRASGNVRTVSDTPEAVSALMALDPDALVKEGERRLRRRGATRLTAIVVDEDVNAMAFWHATGLVRQTHRARFARDL
jgi:hypothetical protein